MKRHHASVLVVSCLVWPANQVSPHLTTSHKSGALWRVTSFLRLFCSFREVNQRGLWATNRFSLPVEYRRQQPAAAAGTASHTFNLHRHLCSTFPIRSPPTISPSFDPSETPINAELFGALQVSDQVLPGICSVLCQRTQMMIKPLKNQQPSHTRCGMQNIFGPWEASRCTHHQNQTAMGIINGLIATNSSTGDLPIFPLLKGRRAGRRCGGLLWRWLGVTKEEGGVVQR